MLVPLATPDKLVPSRRPVGAIGNQAPLSLIQERFWLIDQAIVHRAVYNVLCRVRVRGPLDVDAFRAAWAAVVERQEILRSYYADVRGAILQIVDPSAPFDIAAIDLRNRPEEIESL